MAPKWAHAPLSGTGAATHGGRFNRQGQAALYMSSNLETARVEYGQDIADRPGTFCRYDVTINDIADMRNRNACAKLGVSPTLLACPWKKILLIDKAEPPTWPLVDRLLMAGAAGALTPSYCHPLGYNLVLWQWNNDQVKPFDPNNDLAFPS